MAENLSKLCDYVLPYLERRLILFWSRIEWSERTVFLCYVFPAPMSSLAPSGTAICGTKVFRRSRVGLLIFYRAYVKASPEWFSMWKDILQPSPFSQYIYCEKQDPESTDRTITVSLNTSLTMAYRSVVVFGGTGAQAGPVVRREYRPSPG